MLKRIARAWLACVFLLPMFWGNEAVRAQSTPLPVVPVVDPQVYFVQNLRQFEAPVQFAADLPGGRVFAEGDRLTYVFYDAEVVDARMGHSHDWKQRPLPEKVNMHAFRMHFQGARPVQAQARQLRTEYHNYYLGNDPGRWATQVPLSNEIFYEGLWPGIDLRLYGQDEALKYDILLAPGADPARIRLEYEGLDALSLDEGRLNLRTSVNLIQEQRPVAWQLRDGEKIPVACAFTLSGTTVGFSFPQGYDPALPLVIDPTLIFSSYSGSTANNFGYTATWDMDGHLYGGGIVFNTGYPVSPGAYQMNFGGGTQTSGPFGPIDIGITKFNGTGNTRLYSTYLGGADNDHPASMMVNHLNELVVLGKTWSNDFPVAFNAFDPTHNGGADIVLARLSTDGRFLLGGTYLGGSGDDGVNMNSNFLHTGLMQNYADDSRGEVFVDKAGNVFIASCSQSGNFPVTPGVVQQGFGGRQDAVVCKLNEDLSALTWATYLGGSDYDASYGIRVMGNGSIVVAGGTMSPNFPVSAGAHQTSNLGGVDGFITRLNPNGNVLQASTYLGTTGYNQCYFVDVDRQNNVYVYGQTTGPWPITPGAYANANSGQFICKLNSQLNTVLISTTIGSGSGSPNISPTAFMVDACDYIYLSGWGGAVNAGYIAGNTNGMPVTPDAFQGSTDGSDFYVAVLTRDMVALDYATYIGGTLSHEHVDGGTSRFWRRAEIYQAVCGGCYYNSDFPMQNAVSALNGSSCNLTVFKIDFPLPGILADFRPLPQASGCLPLTVNFQNYSVGGTSFSWNFDDPLSGANNTSTLLNPTHTFDSAGLYEVMLIAVDPNSCNVRDTAYRVIAVYPKPIAQVTPDTVLCANGPPLQLQASGGLYYSWTPSGSLSAMTGPVVYASPTVNTTYQVIVSNGTNCSDTATVSVSLRPEFQATTDPGGRICLNDSIPLRSSGGVTYLWSPPLGVADPAAGSTHASPPVTTLYTVTAVGPDGCPDVDTVLVQVVQVTADAGPDQSPCAGDTVTLNGSGQGGSVLSWSPVALVQNPNAAVTQAWAGQDTTFTLTVTDASGCRGYDTVRIDYREPPQIVAGPDTIVCNKQPVPLFANGAVTYFWTPTAHLSNPNIANPIANPHGNTVWIVRGTDAWGCVGYDTVDVQVRPTPDADAGADLRLCTDSTVQLSSGGGIAYLWAPPQFLNDPTLENPLATPVDTTDFVVTVYAANGCWDRDTVRINVVPVPVANAGPDRDICEDLGVRLQGSVTGDSFLWSTGATTPGITVTPAADTWYVLYTSLDGCPGVPDSVQVRIHPNLVFADFTATPDSGWLPLDVQFDNLSQNGTHYLWTFGDGDVSTAFSPGHIYADTGHYHAILTVTDAYGCSDTAMKSIIVVGEYALFVPNAFTPNDDLKNDFFFATHYGIADLHVMIFDRWGMLIYESFDKDFRWGGVLHDQACQEGAYVWVIDGHSLTGRSFKLSGSVTLLR